MMRTIVLFCAAALCIGVAQTVEAQSPPPVAHDVNALAKETQNPVSSLISVPFQFNFNSGGDLDDRAYLNVNIQPVIPFAISENWKVIARTIVPLDSFPTEGETRSSGVGNIQEQVFFSPARPGRVVWGVGPAFSFPTATAAHAETGTWAAGVTAVVVKTTGSFVLGAVMSQVWPLADAGDAPETNLLTVQPFVNYNFGTGWALSTSPIISANWDATAGNEWTVPLGFGLTRTTVFNRRPMNVGVQYYYNAERPDGSAGQQLRFVIALLYPGS